MRKIARIAAAATLGLAAVAASAEQVGWSFTANLYGEHDPLGLPIDEMNALTGSWFFDTANTNHATDPWNGTAIYQGTGFNLSVGGVSIASFSPEVGISNGYGDFMTLTASWRDSNWAGLADGWMMDTAYFVFRAYRDFDHVQREWWDNTELPSVLGYRPSMDIFRGELNFTNRFTGEQVRYDVGNMNIAPIPEPSTYALMALGLGAIGFAARRRQQAALA